MAIIAAHFLLLFGSLAGRDRILHPEGGRGGGANVEGLERSGVGSIGILGRRLHVGRGALHGEKGSRQSVVVDALYLCPFPSKLALLHSHLLKEKVPLTFFESCRSRIMRLRILFADPGGR